VSLTEDVPRVDLRELVALARGGRGGPRVLRSTRQPSAGGWSIAAGWRGLRGDVETWRLRVALALGEHTGRLALDNGHETPVVRVHAEPMHLGGCRWWATCPECGRRCRIVFVHLDRVGCRVCWRLTYRSQLQPDDMRARHRLYALAERLGGDSDDVTEWGRPPPRPPRMRRATYARHVGRWDALAERERAGWVRAAARWC